MLEARRAVAAAEAEANAARTAARVAAAAALGKARGGETEVEHATDVEEDVRAHEPRDAEAEDAAAAERLRAIYPR